jgi:hypothetical protein
MTNIASYVSTNSNIVTAITNNVRETDIDLSSGSVTAPYPSSVSFQVYRISNANSSNTVTLPVTLGFNFIIIWNDSATDTVDISSAFTFQPAGGTSVTLSAGDIGVYLYFPSVSVLLTIN